ncbi:MAG TPA: exo-alpha-sialidase [Candidatus Bathyarchaeia archaeon]|nr:exo-alpha-sialidase [Candidatus Bathyarchaeia archaeon]
MHNKLAAAAIIITTLIITPFSSSASWSNETRLTTDSNSDWRPSVAYIKDGKTWVAWHSYRTGLADLFYKTTSNDGASWSPDTRLTFDPSNDVHPAIMQTRIGAIWVVWASNRTGNFDLFYKTSSDNGVSWSAETQLTTDLGKDILSSTAQTNDGHIWVVWMSTRSGNDDLFYKTSVDNGLTWTGDQQLTQDSDDDRAPCVTQVQNGITWVVWSSNRQGNFEIYYKTSSDNGASWSGEARLTRDPDFDLFPSIAQARDGTIWVAWDSDRISYRGDPQDDLLYSIYDGVTWSSDTQLTTNETDDFMASTAQGKTELWVVWVSDRTGNYEIFYKTVHITAHDVAVTSLLTSPTRAYIGQQVSVSVNVENHGDYMENITVSLYSKLTSDSLIGAQTATLANGTSTTLTFTWTPNMTGLYEIRAEAMIVSGEIDTDDNIYTRNQLLVTISGDINNDRAVNVHDLFTASRAYGSDENSPNWNSDADINNDGTVDTLDIEITSAHWGQSW